MSNSGRVDKRSLFREVNERMRHIEDTSFGGELEGGYAIFCECVGLDCVERIDVPQDVYVAARSDEYRFLIAPGHERLGEERVVVSDATYRVVASLLPAA